MNKTFAGAVLPSKAPSIRRGLSIITLEHSYGLNGSRIFDPTQLAPLGNVISDHYLDSPVKPIFACEQSNHFVVNRK